jgi:HEAT repeat protein
VDLYSREYEKRLVAALARSSAERRAQICWLLGSRGKRSAVPALIELLRDPDIFVRVAALRGLGEIGDESAVPEIEKAARSGNLAVRTVASNVLKMFGVSTAGVDRRPA